MTKENKTPDFASEQAGEFWAEIKAEYGDKVSIEDVKGTGKDGAITKGDVEAYFDALTANDEVDGDNGAQAQADAPQADEKVETDPAPESTKKVKPIKGKTLRNLTDNNVEIDGVRIEPKGEVKLDEALAVSKRVAHGIETGMFAVK